MTVFVRYLEWDKRTVQEPEILEFLRILALVSWLSWRKFYEDTGNV